MLLSLLTIGRLNPPFAWERYHPNRQLWSEFLDITTISLVGAFLMALVLVFIPGDQVGSLIISMR